MNVSACASFSSKVSNWATAPNAVSTSIAKVHEKDFEVHSPVRGLIGGLLPVGALCEDFVHPARMNPSLRLSPGCSRMRRHSLTSMTRLQAMATHRANERFGRQAVMKISVKQCAYVNT